MGLRFRKSIRLFPGVRINLSKGGVSASVGRPGATINIGRKGVRSTVGLPGSGLSYSEMLMDGKGEHVAPVASRTAGGGAGCVLFAIVALLIAAVATCTYKRDAAPDPTVLERPVGRPLFVTANSLNCRVQASPSATVVGKRTRGEALTVVTSGGEWTQVESANGACWMATRYLSVASPGLVPAPPKIDRVASQQSERRASVAPSRSAARSRASARALNREACSCASHAVCIGPRGGRYCLTSGGAKRYGV